MRLTMLGTGNALVTKCYNTCFVIDGEGGPVMVDGGGGNAVLRQLELAGLDWRDMRDVFVTHKHIDHLLGVVWMVRMICQHMEQGDYDGEARIYANGEVCDLLRSAANDLLPAKHARHLGERLALTEVHDGDAADICGRRMEFFDIGSTKAAQMGFRMGLPEGGTLVCCGDEPCSERVERYARGASWMLHEAFCLRSQADVFHPYEKHHSTVADACELAERLGVGNLVLYHTEDANLARRGELYLAEGAPLFGGGLYVPDDLETIELL